MSSPPSSTPSTSTSSAGRFPVDLTLDPAVFGEAAIDPSTRQLNQAILKIMADMPDRWSMPAAEVRRLRAETGKPFPLAPLSPRAETIMIDGPGGQIPLRVMLPDPAAPRGVYLHIHGGGWMLGAHDQQDPMLERIADKTGMAVVSVGYRLAPEDPYPAAPDDCEAAALWLIEAARDRFGADRFVIGGESGGAHLCAVTLVRLRDRHGLTPFRGVMLNSGCYDLRMTPSARAWGDEPLVINTLDVHNFAVQFVAEAAAFDDPDVSPLLADLGGLPPALFVTGTRDPLVDDSLMMAARWMAAGNEADLTVWPGGCHVFTGFPGPMPDQANAHIDSFLSNCVEGL